MKTLTHHLRILAIGFMLKLDAYALVSRGRYTCTNLRTIKSFLGIGARKNNGSSALLWLNWLAPFRIATNASILGICTNTDSASDFKRAVMNANA
jgi:hypothetical protein